VNQKDNVRFWKKKKNYYFNNQKRTLFFWLAEFIFLEIHSLWQVNLIGLKKKRSENLLF